MNLIDKDKLLNYLYNIQDKKVDIAFEIANFKTENIIFAKHGKWLTTHLFGLWKCSNCGFNCEFNYYKYCPHCGAKMDWKG